MSTSLIELVLIVALVSFILKLLSKIHRFPISLNAAVLSGFGNEEDSRLDSRSMQGHM
jgi:hypothetical protein